MRPTRTRRCLLAVLVVLSACAGGPPAPDWQINAHGSLDRATAAYLEGDSRIAAQEFARARAELARTGKPELVARGELTACAARVASLEFDDCPGFAPLAVDAGEELRAYARYLDGQSDSGDVDRLPARHRAVAAGSPSAAALAAITDPLSRLVAAGVTMRRGQAGPAIATIAVETASQQGWRRPLLAWLTIQHEAARTAGDAGAAAAVRRRIELLSPAPPTGGASGR